MNKYYFISLIITLFIMFLFTYCVFQKVKIVYRLINCIKAPTQKILYCFFMFMSSFAYIFISLIFNDVCSELSSIFSALYLLFSIWTVNIFFEKICPKNELKVSDKHWAIILSYICVAISGGIISIQCGSSEYLTVSSIAISVLIGSYISVETFLKNKSLIVLLTEYIDSVKKTSKDVKMILESSFVFVILLFLCFSSYNDIVNQIIYGIATGEVIFLFIFFIYIISFHTFPWLNGFFN